MTRTVTQEDFLNRCVSKHGDRYDYTQTVYSSGKAKVDIICKKHGIFSQLPSVHSLGSGCPKCGRESSESSKVKYDEVSFREKVSHIWGGLDFTKTKYVHPKEKIVYTCLKHGDKQVFPFSLLSGHGWKNENLTLTDRVFECKVCDMKMDRDLNASLNLKNLAVSSTVSACGEQSSEKAISLSCSVKQEINKKLRVYILKI